MKKDFMIELLVGLLIGVSAGAIGLYCGYSIAINGSDLTLPNGIEIHDYDGITTVIFPENVTTARKAGQIDVFVRQNNGRNVSIASEEGVFLAPGVSLIVIPDEKNATKLNASAYGEKMIVTSYSGWEQYRTAKLAMDNAIKPAVLEAFDRWTKDQPSKTYVTPLNSSSKEEVRAYMNRLTDYVKTIKTNEERRYICNANNSVFNAIVFPERF